MLRPRKGRRKERQPSTDHDPMDAIERALILNVSSGRSKKGVSVSHLLDFSLPSRETGPPLRPVARRRRSVRTRHALTLSGKEFINVNCRFIVRETGHYEQQMLDPNIPLRSEDVLRVIARNINACPICLESSEAVALRMVSCGHCFCLPCLLMYLAREEDQASKNHTVLLKACPLCAQRISPSETMPVLRINLLEEEEQMEALHAGHDAVLKLMVRPHGAINAFPVSAEPQFEKNNAIPWCAYGGVPDDQVFPYARIMKGDLDFVLKLYEEEIEEIAVRENNNKLMYGSDDEYSEIAIKEIKKAMEDLKLTYKESHAKKEQVPVDISKLSIQPDLESKYGSAFFYYQANFSSATKFFLSSLDVRILRAVYGTYLNFPSALVLPIESVAHGEVLTEENVDRYKYISHLPFGTVMSFMEVDWLVGRKDPSRFRLPDNIFAHFKREILARSKANKRRDHVEEHNRRVAQRNLELKTREFFERENWEYKNPNVDYDARENYVSPRGHSSLKEEYLPLNDPGEDEGANGEDFDTTVWGTKIKKTEQQKVESDEDEDIGLSPEEIIKKVQEHKGKKGKKKKLVLFTGTGRGA